MTNFYTLLSKSYYVLTLFQSKRLFIVFTCMLVLGVLELAGIASVVPFVQIIENPEIIEENKWINSVYVALEFQSVQSFTVFFGVCVIAMLTLNNVTAAAVTWLVASFVNKQGHYLSCYLIKEYVNRPYSFFLESDSSDLTKNLLNEVHRAVNSVQFALMQALSRLIISVMIILLLIVVNFQTAITVSVILISAYLIIYKILRQRIVEAGKIAADMVTERYRIVSETFDAIKEIKMRNQEDLSARRFIEPSFLFAHSSTNAIIFSVLPKYLLEIVAFGGVIILMLSLYISEPTSTSVMSIMSLYVFAGYRLIPSLQQIYQSWTKVRYHYPALEIVHKDLIDLNIDFDKEHLSEGISQVIEFDKNIVLEGIDFYYAGRNLTVLKGVSVSIKKNTCIAFVGESGAGKSTLVDLLLGIQEPESGQIKIDGQSLSKNNVASWREKIGYVPQTIILLNNSIANNIAFEFDDERVDMARVKLAAKIAGLDKFIETLDDGFATITGENGLRLSGGQRQRVGIARALYRDPEILIFDEATSALDGLTEDIIMSSINTLKQEKTIIIVAHRLSTIQDCDVIHVMDQGQIIDSGDYTYLINHNEIFKKMAKV